MYDSLAGEQTVIRFSVPDCPWGYKIKSFDEMDDCYEEYRFHCIEGHGVAAESEFYIHFDLGKLMLSVFQK
jgi:hypothetical protein